LIKEETNLEGCKMKLHRLGKAEDFREVPKIVQVGTKHIGIYYYDKKFYAYENVCPHEGGPACEGITIGDTKFEMVQGETGYREFLSEEMNIACPWHGVEYGLKTGISRADKKLRLKRFRLTVKDGILGVWI
jgi:nitrite reductase/ring-hydroxylating ferredoxin subunit